MAQNQLTLSELADLPVGRLTGVGVKKEKGLAELGITSLFDLLTYYPRRYIDRTNEALIEDLSEGDEASVLVTVEQTDQRRVRGGKVMVTSTVSDSSGRLKVTFFNQPWRRKQLAPGRSAVIYGTVSLFRGQPQMTNPVVDLVGDKTGRIVPVYPQSEKAGLHSWDLAGWVAEALRRCLPPLGRGLADPLPKWVRKRHDLQPRAAAVTQIHQPESMAAVWLARKRLVFDELLRLQLAMVAQKRYMERTSQGVAHELNGPLASQFIDQLPFPLTAGQRQSIDEITADMGRTYPMNRLLQGDVGAGKTVVALAAMLTAVDGGHQAALMAPTEVLAEQHYEVMSRALADVTVVDDSTLFAERPLRVALLTNALTATERKATLSDLLLGNVDLVVGTHALIQEGVVFSSLGVAVVDEQHRFGVEQRAALREQNYGGTTPDVLVMTATPIPRTAAMTVYGDLDISILDELPAGRRPIKTQWVPAPGTLTESTPPDAQAELTTMWSQVRSQVADGRQAYIVCPLIDESESIQIAAADTAFERLRAHELEGLRVGLLHGRVRAAEKEETMALFRDGHIDVLVATTVIEVGVDVPNATVMVILDADRFGIAQLHQLRGRVGRGKHQSFCWLVGEATTDTGVARLEALVSSTDGFELAEIDLDLRGEGTILGDRQKGRNDLKLASLRRDREAVTQARKVAVELLDSDPLLAESPELAAEMELFLDADRADYLFKN